MIKKGLVKGAVILTAAGVICRLLGVVFRIPFANIVGNYGIGLYQLVFPLYSLLLIISSAGIPVAISKMIARVRDDRTKTRQIFVNALVALVVIGTVITAAFLALAWQLSAWQGKPEIWPLYLAIAPAVWFVCVISALRGYFQGLTNMVPTAVSQVVEQVVKVGVALGLAFWLINYDVLWAVFGAVLAVSVSELVAAVVLGVIYLVKEKPWRQPKPEGKMLSWTVMKQIFVMAAPIMVMSLAFPVVQLFDSFFIVNALKSAGVDNATELYGIASGAVHTLINLPTVVGVAIATVLLPMVSRCFKQKNTTEMKHKAMGAVWLTLAFGVLATITLAVFPKFILQLLYHRTFAGKAEELATAVLLLRVESVAVVLICLTQVIGSILQGVDQARWPMYALLIGGAAKVILEIFALRTWGIVTVSIANVLCYTIALVVCVVRLIKFMRQR